MATRKTTAAPAGKAGLMAKVGDKVEKVEAAAAKRIASAKKAVAAKTEQTKRKVDAMLDKFSV